MLIVGSQLLALFTKPFVHNREVFFPRTVSILLSVIAFRTLDLTFLHLPREINTITLTKATGNCPFTSSIVLSIIVERC